MTVAKKLALRAPRVRTAPPKWQYTMMFFRGRGSRNGRGEAAAATRYWMSSNDVTLIYGRPGLTPPSRYYAVDHIFAR